MWYAVYDTATGALVSVGSSLGERLREGLSYVELGEGRPAGQWNPQARAFDPVPEARPALDPVDFMRRFAFAEEVAIRTAARSDVRVEVFLARLQRVQQVRLDHPETIAGIGLLTQLGLLTQDRAAQILA